MMKKKKKSKGEIGNDVQVQRDTRHQRGDPVLHTTSQSVTCCRLMSHGRRACS